VTLDIQPLQQARWKLQVDQGKFMTRYKPGLAPRYTSYFRNGPGLETGTHSGPTSSNKFTKRPIGAETRGFGLYMHIPFCQSLWPVFGGRVQRHHQKKTTGCRPRAVSGCLENGEIAHVGARFNSKRQVNAISLGGRHTKTFFPPAQGSRTFFGIYARNTSAFEANGRNWHRSRSRRFTSRAHLESVRKSVPNRVRHGHSGTSSPRCKKAIPPHPTVLK